MDYINLTVDQMFRLISLQNVTGIYRIKDLLEKPAVTDLLMELHNSKWPSGTYVTHRMVVRNDIDLDLGPGDTEYLGTGGMHTLLDDDQKQRITDWCVCMTSSTYTRLNGNMVKVSVFTTCMTAVKGGIDIIVDLPRETALKSGSCGAVPDSTQAVNVGQFVYRAWLELNWLILNQPQAVRTGRIAQDLIPLLKKAAGKPRKKAAKGRTKVYLRMLTVPPEKSPDWESLKAKTPEAVQERTAREITCPVWEVRGHMRHYKSGKTAYVAPYRKGKERDRASAVSGKEYVLTGGNHAGKD